MSPTEALDALFAENELPMSDRNGVLYDALRDALAEKAELSAEEIINLWEGENVGLVQLLEFARAVLKKANK